MKIGTCIEGPDARRETKTEHSETNAPDMLELDLHGTEGPQNTAVMRAGMLTLSLLKTVKGAESTERNFIALVLGTPGLMGLYAPQTAAQARTLSEGLLKAADELDRLESQGDGGNSKH